jgi:hypothetical protein
VAVLIDILAAGVVDTAGGPLAGGQVYVYEPGTTTKVDVWQDADLSVPHANPLTLDANGTGEVYVNQAVRVVIEDSTGASISDIESVGEIASLEGDVTLGADSSDTVYVNGRIRGDLDPAIPATYQIGDATNTWKDVHLDGGVTDGGAVYFDGSDAKYIKASADGTELDIGGFTALKADEATTITLKDEVHVIPGTANGTLEIGDGTGTGTDPQLSLNSNTGDATLRLMVNNAAANAWDIRNDNSASDVLLLQYNGTTAASLSTTGNLRAVLGVAATGTDYIRWKILSGTSNASGEVIVAHGLTAADIRGLVGYIFNGTAQYAQSYTVSGNCRQDWDGTNAKIGIAGFTSQPGKILVFYV